MRYPREHKQAIRKRIIREASRRFRQQGADGFSIADLMHDLHLTHGGLLLALQRQEPAIC